MDSFSDPAITMVVFQKCARIGGTEAGLNIVGYFIHQDPSPVMIVQPTVDDAKDFSKEQLAPMVADTPVLAALVSDPRSRDSSNTVQVKSFPGGALFLVGANSPRGFRRRTARVLDLEEVDGYPASAGTEGDQIKLALRRAATFAHRRKVYLNSTPTLKGVSRIEDYYLRSDQRQYHIPCPECGTRQPLVWRNLQWEQGHPETVQYACAVCGVLWPEERKFRALGDGVWVPQAPSGAVRGYHINALYSPWVSWRELVEEWTEAQGDVLKLQVFVNTALGETWEDRGGALEPLSLEARAESYAAEVPDGVGLLTAGVDVQDTRLEVSVVGWGQGEEAWLIRHQVFHGDPSTRALWEGLEAMLAGTFVHGSGAVLRISTVCVDSGHNANAVYDFCRPRFARRVYACKGSSTAGAPIAPRRPTRNNKGKVPLFLIGTESAKDVLYGMLRTTVPGPKYLHTPTGTDAEWYLQVTAERVVRKQINGRWVRRYELPRGVRNEALDCLVYALAALHLSPEGRGRLGVLAARLAGTGPALAPVAPIEPAAVGEVAPVLAPRPRPAPHSPKPRGGWLKGRW